MGRGLGGRWGANPDPGEPKGTGSERRHRHQGCPRLAWGGQLGTGPQESHRTPKLTRVSGLEKASIATPDKPSHGKMEVIRDTVRSLDLRE